MRFGNPPKSHFMMLHISDMLLATRIVEDNLLMLSYVTSSTARTRTQGLNLGVTGRATVHGGFLHTAC